MKRSIELLGFGYVFLLALLLFGNQLFRASLPPLALVATFSPFLFLPLAVQAGFWLLKRSRPAGLSLVLGAGLLLWFHPLFPWRALAAPPVAAGGLTAMTFNLGWTVTSPEPLAESIRETGADLVAVQEITAETAAYFSSRLAAVYPYQVLDPERGTNGLLSRHPIRDHAWLIPPNGRPILHAVIEVEERPLHVFAVHFSAPQITWLPGAPLPTGLREERLPGQVAFLLETTRQVSGPIIILGDFNMSEQSAPYNDIRSQFRDAFRDGGLGFGFTFPHDIKVRGRDLPTPLVRIDYVFYSDDLRIVEAGVRCFPGRSDHCALQAYFAG